MRWDMGTAIEALRRGFAPWGCIVHVYGFEKALRCRIVDFQGHPIIADLHLCSSELTEPSRLCSAIDETRARLEEHGFALQPWKTDGVGLRLRSVKRFPVGTKPPLLRPGAEMAARVPVVQRVNLGDEAFQDLTPRS